MAFDFVSGSISLISLIIIIIVSILLYINIRNTKKQVDMQLEDLIKQFNSGQVYLYNMAQRQKNELSKRVECLKCPEATK